MTMSNASIRLWSLVDGQDVVDSHTWDDVNASLAKKGVGSVARRV